MALRQLVMSKRIEALRASLTELDTEKAALELRRAELATREAEIEAALNEVTAETPDEERQTVEAEAAQFEQDSQQLTGEETENATKRANIEQQIASLLAELDELNERAKAPAAIPTHKEPTERKDEMNMNTRAFFGMSVQERDALFAREDVKTFLQRTREMGRQQRAVNGSEMLIPDVLLGVIREQTAQASKLLKHVNHRRITGTSRVIVAGTIPEAVWTEMCGTLNEMSIGFYGDEMDGWKVGGYIAVCKALLEDSDINLATEIMEAISKALGYALDKAILYGTGVKMPMGIVTRLAQTAQPDNYSGKARPWENLSDTHLQTITAKTGLELFQELKLGMAKASNKHATGGKFWAMNESTKTMLDVQAMSLNAQGVITTGMPGAAMPSPLGGSIETLDFIPDGVIIGGYGELYYLAERAGVQLAMSEHVRFLEEQIVYKGTARYDGKPIIAEGFVAIGIDVAKPAADAVTFAPDTANAG